MVSSFDPPESVARADMSPSAIGRNSEMHVAMHALICLRAMVRAAPSFQLVACRSNRILDFLGSSRIVNNSPALFSPFAPHSGH